jgi:hypothetical protein
LPLGGIRILGVPFGFVFFTSSFMKEALGKDVRHANVFLNLGDVYVTFGILFRCFAYKPSFLLCCFLSFQVFEINLPFFIQP